MFRLIAATGLLSLAGCASVAEPAYRVVLAEAPFEVRACQPMIVAETRIEGERGAAANAGFRILADYIFGNNTAKAEIAMTAPVTQAQDGQEIAMTAPVMQAPAGSAWVVGFVMPAEWTLDTLPTPNDPRVVLRRQDGRHVAVVRFAGTTGEGAVRRETEALERWLAAKGMTPAGAPVVARYDPPWTLPMFRRNEIQIEILQGSPADRDQGSSASGTSR